MLISFSSGGTAWVFDTTIPYSGDGLHHSYMILVFFLALLLRNVSERGAIKTEALRECWKVWGTHT